MKSRTPSPASRSSASRRSSRRCATRVTEFLNRIFEPTRYQANANLRGFYLSSGTQEGTPIDQVLGAMGRSLAVDDSGAPSVRAAARASSCTTCLKQRHLRRVRAGFRWTRNAVRRAAIFRYGAMATIARRLAGHARRLGLELRSNKALISSAGAAVDDYRIAAKEELSRKEISGAEQISGDDLTAIASHLSQLRTMPAGYAHTDETTPLGETFGLSSATGCSPHRRSPTATPWSGCCARASSCGSSSRSSAP